VKPAGRPTWWCIKSAFISHSLCTLAIHTGRSWHCTRRRLGRCLGRWYHHCFNGRRVSSAVELEQGQSVGAAAHFGLVPVARHVAADIAIWCRTAAPSDLVVTITFSRILGAGVDIACGSTRIPALGVGHAAANCGSNSQCSATSAICVAAL
jgi:hypothetical protein